MKKILLIVICIFSCAPVSSVFTKSNDFSWLRPFVVISEVLSVDHWEKDTKFMRFDSSGIVLGNNNYNPVTISQYALACFEHYRNTKDENYKQKFLVNAQWLMDEKNYVKIDSDRIGYPYKFQFRDLKPGWYSGLSQSEVVSVLIRYYYLTRDDKVLNLIKKVNNLMLHPIGDGGLIDTTPEKMIWIEEYPGSKQHKHVLNGYLVSLFGLYEYTQMFPEDKRAARMLSQGYESLKKSVQFYETASNNLTYDRGSKQAVNNWYMKAQVFEMRALYDISGDDFYKACSMLWSTYTFNRPLNYVGCKLNNWNLSVPMRIQPNGWFAAVPSLDIINLNDQVRKVNAAQTRKGFEVQKTYDSNFHTYLQFLSGDSIDEKPYIEYEFKASQLMEGLIFFAGTDSIRSKITALEYKTTHQSSWKKAKVGSYELLDKNAYLFFNEALNVSVLRIEFEKPAKGKTLMLSEIQIGKKGKALEPLHLHYLSEVQNPIGEKFKIDFDLQNNSAYKVFYKSASNAAALKSTPWNPHSHINSKDEVIMRNNSFYQFVVVMENNSTVALRNFKLNNL
ncbi:MAG TPA: D-glucuronyl C5-epimerase family protein [Bacteroidia bacterium]|nr:D-glucuronyl C5-epimerase family protein [Bacteroidia bacterium]HNT80377.1 D-glucuronyl C5-epimerase family protein [Bacteroidia bacterium]